MAGGSDMADPASRQAGLSEEFAWSLLDAAPDGMLVVDRKGVVVFASAQAGELLATTRDGLVGRNVDDFVPDDVRRAHLAHRTRYQADPTLRTMGAGLVLRARRVDGTEFPVEISLSPLTAGDEHLTVAALRDVTARVETEDHLHRVLATLDASDDAVFIFDADTLRYSYVNDGAVRLVGYSREDLESMTPLHLNPLADEAEYRELIGRLLADPEHAVVRESVLVARDGSEVPVEKTFQAAPVGRDETRWIVALARDTRARLEAESELRRSQDALRQAEQVLVVAEDRERIARDLHDTVIQRLFGAGLQLQATMGSADDRTRERLDTVVADLDETIKELRAAIFSLQGSVPSPRGVRGRLFDVVSESGARLGFEPRLELGGPIESLSEPIIENLVAVLREALANVGRHARARTVRVTLDVGELVVLTVSDDGIGVPGEVVGGRGLANLERRACDLGGSFAITAGPEGGSVLRWAVPT
jgi:PAS domain S-box-containing protein